MLKKRWKTLSKYTTTLRFICESSPEKKLEVIETFSDYKLSDYLTPKQEDLVINSNWSKEKLANKIIRHYYFREIGFETWGLFKHYAKIEMEKIMEHYLPLIYSRCIEYDPLINVDFKEIFTESSNSKNTSTGDSSNKSDSFSDGNSKFSDTPNVSLDNIKNDKYLTNITISDSSTNINGTAHSENISNGENTHQYTKQIVGNSGVSATAQKMIEQFRQNIIAIDSQIINALQSLFMSLY